MNSIRLKRRNVLAHYGVLGMRWGHYKSEEASPVNTRTDRFVLKKGSILRRVSTNPNEENTGRAYATFKKWDSVGYMARSLPFAKTFNMTMVAKEDLISPSKKERVDAFIDLCKKDGTLLRDLATAKYQMTRVYSQAAFEKQYKKMSEAQLRARAYEDMSINLNFDKSLRDRYFKELSDRGYNMVLDDADAAILSNSPICVFDRGKSLEVASIDRVTVKYLLNFAKKGGDS